MAWLFGIGTSAGVFALMCLASMAAVSSLGPAAGTPASVIVMLPFAIWAGFDSQKIEFHKYGGLLGRQKPLAITLGCVLLFIIVFALYMTKRWQITHKQVLMLAEFHTQATHDAN